jgi:hypothetical protein
VIHDVEAAEMPGWLVKLCLKPTPSPAAPRLFRPPAGGDGSRYGLGALRAECGLIRGAAFGTQRSTLNDAALKVGSLIAAGELTESCAIAALLVAGNSMSSQTGREPWVSAQIEKIVRDAIAVGQRHPRQVTPPSSERRV